MTFPSASITGITWNESSGKWQVRVTHNGTRNYLGSFTDIEDARRAYNRFAKKNGMKTYKTIEARSNVSGIFWDNDYGRFRVCVWKENQRHYGKRHHSFRDALTERNKIARSLSLAQVS